MPWPMLSSGTSDITLRSCASDWHRLQKGRESATGCRAAVRQGVVISAAENGGDSANVLAHVDEWVLRQKPDVVHLNCGLHDLKRSKTDGHHQVEVDRYSANPTSPR